MKSFQHVGADAFKDILWNMYVHESLLQECSCSSQLIASGVHCKFLFACSGFLFVYMFWNSSVANYASLVGLMVGQQPTCCAASSSLICSVLQATKIVGGGCRVTSTSSKLWMGSAMP